jgi:hypothetical protein
LKFLIIITDLLKKSSNYRVLRLMGCYKKYLTYYDIYASMYPNDRIGYL